MVLSTSGTAYRLHGGFVCTVDANLAGVHTFASRAERGELLPLPNKHFRSTGCDLYRLSNDARLGEASFRGFDV